MAFLTGLLRGTVRGVAKFAGAVVVKISILAMRGVRRKVRREAREMLIWRLREDEKLIRKWTQKSDKPGRPGQPFKSKTGKARKRIATAMVGALEGGVGFQGEGLDYTGYLEKGTRKMEPRPTLARGLEMERDRAKARLGEMSSSRL